MSVASHFSAASRRCFPRPIYFRRWQIWQNWLHSVYQVQREMLLLIGIYHETPKKELAKISSLVYIRNGNRIWANAHLAVNLRFFIFRVSYERLKANRSQTCLDQWNIKISYFHSSWKQVRRNHTFLTCSEDEDFVYTNPHGPMKYQCESPDLSGKTNLSQTSKKRYAGVNNICIVQRPDMRNDKL